MPLGPKLAEAQRLRNEGAAAGEARFMLLGAFGVLVVMLFTTLGPHKASAFNVERRLGEAAHAALVQAGFNDIEVRMSGQTAILDGVVSSQSDVAKAVAIAQRAGKGGIVRVINHVSSAGAALPRRWAALSVSGVKGAGLASAPQGASHNSGEDADGALMAARLIDFGTNLNAQAGGAGAWPI